MITHDSDDKFIFFEEDVQHLPLPKLFNFPFNYTPSYIAKKAAVQVQKYLSKTYIDSPEFGLDGNAKGLGKMMGILVVKRRDGLLGFLSAFSGKLAGLNHHEYFVPPVFDMLKEDGFFRIGEEKINVVTRKIEKIQVDETYLALQQDYHTTEQESNQVLAQVKLKHAQAKKERAKKRQEITPQDNQAEAILEALRNESAMHHYEIKDVKRQWAAKLDIIKEKVNVFTELLSSLHEDRKAMSASIQDELFNQYLFLNKDGITKSIRDIFLPTVENMPPSGAGECAAPKLLQYAFKQNYTPIALAEFWWGKAPDSEIRKHGHFYPACNSKCKPILAHMLTGIDIEEDPTDIALHSEKTIEVLYEDDTIIAINKPHNLLSVPGRFYEDSAYTRIKKMYPEATGPLIVHRLDMITSGILLIAKTMQAYHHLQKQFATKTIHKMYTALLDGTIDKSEGEINLPLRVNLEDRPNQIVCYEHGKEAITKYEVVHIENNKTRIRFYPITGRTHQLRVHAAHPLGLNTPIVGDDLYGERADRLYLHATTIEFLHPKSGELMKIICECPF
jgi:tRNA pseudouridine32 synthase / 23S rRNA pseudouridine746 synthase